MQLSTSTGSFKFLGTSGAVILHSLMRLCIHLVWEKYGACKRFAFSFHPVSGSESVISSFLLAAFTSPSAQVLRPGLCTCQQHRILIDEISSHLSSRRRLPSPGWFPLASCDAIIYDDLDPCDEGLRLRFVYDYNMGLPTHSPRRSTA